MKKFGFKVPVLLFALLFTVTSSAFAYSYYQSGPFVYKMSGGIASGYYNNFSSNITYNNKSYNFNTAYESAISYWNSYTEANLVPLPSGSTATPKVTMLSATLTDFPSTYGATNFYKVTSSGITLINPSPAGHPPGENAPNSDWDYAYTFVNVSAIDLYPGGMDYTKYRGVSIHEIGHAFGLAHWTSTPSVMDNSPAPGGKMKMLENGYTVPQAEDIAGVNALY